MSQCYTVWGKILFNNNDSSEFVNELRKAIECAPLCEKCDMTKTDPAYYIRFLITQSADVNNDGYYTYINAEFNATYSYESVLIDIFEKAVKCLKSGSYITVMGDDWESRHEMRPDDLASKIATFITEDGCLHTTNGSQCIYFEEVADEFGVSEEEVKECADDVIDILDGEVCAECYVDDDCFDMMFYLYYCGVEDDEEE